MYKHMIFFLFLYKFKWAKHGHDPRMAQARLKHGTSTVLFNVDLGLEPCRDKWFYKWTSMAQST